MSDVIDVQTAVIGQLLDLLAAVPAFGDAVREARLAIKRVLKGHKAGLTVPGLVRVDFPASAVRLPESGRRWAYRAIPLQVSYSQQL